MVNARNAAIQPGAAGHLDASTLIQKLGVIAGRVDRSRGDVHPGGNPHYLYDPRAGRQVALALGERMARLDAAGAAGFRSRARDLADALRRLAQEGAARARALPPARRRVVAYHDSLAYLHDWLNLEQVATVEPKPGVQPTPSHVTKVLQAMRGGADAPRVVLQEEFYPRKTSDTLARLAGAEVVILPGGARFAAGETYLDRVRRTEEVIHAALAR